MGSKPEGSARPWLAYDDEHLLADCDIEHYRSGGPGGQKRNKTSSAVRLRHHPTGATASASEDRSQAVNRIRALRRLREAIAHSIRLPMPTGTYMPSEVLRSCLGLKKVDRPDRRDPHYYSAIAEFLDVLSANGAGIAATARTLGCSTGQLTKLLREDLKLWAVVNELRKEAGLSLLRK